MRQSRKQPARKRPSPPKGSAKRNKAGAEERRQSDDIERAVYDGMQDLRTERQKDR